MQIESLTQSGGKPRSRDLVRGIAEAIARERLKPGERLPPQRDLAHSLGIAVGTVGRAYAELESAGLIAAHVGRGTFVVGPGSRGGTGGSMPDAAGAEAGSAESEQAKCEIDLLTYRVPIPELPDLVAETLREIADDGGERHLLDNSPAEGDARHRAAMSAWLKGHGLAVDPASIVLTNGGQHAAVAAISTITHPGETIATEELTDPRMKAVAGYLDRRLAGVPCDGDGMIPEALEELCRKRRIAAIYCTPRNQNPMNTTMPAARRIAIAGIAETHDLPIVESDIYGTLCSDEDVPIAAIAPHRTHFLSSLGRIAGPGMKVGCLVSPPAHVVLSRQGVGMSTGTVTRLSAEIATRWIMNGRIGELAEWQRTDIRRRVALVQGLPMLRNARTGDMSAHIWLTLPDPWRSEEFIDGATAHGIAISPTHNFAVGRLNAPHAVRLVISSPRTHGELHRGLSRLERLLRTQPRPHGATAA